ncbi:cobalamin biosynthesis protein [Kitasatospora sp. NPDC085464]|uniref:cobalamin biosynthesis protein n=1 Tax=Kitasatospora sp. NPDC085464 TaxID=3364063 RepID=UPI0037C6C12E
MIGLVAIDGPGRPLADELHALWPEGSHVHRASRGNCSQPPDVLHFALHRYRAVVAVAPLPTVVSLLTGGLVDLPRGTVLLCVDPQRRWVIPMAGGDAAEELSVEVAAALGVTPVPTGHAPWAGVPEAPVAPVGPVAPVEQVAPEAPEDAPILRVTDREDPGDGDLLVLPRTLVVGVGAAGAAERTELVRLLDATLKEAGLARAAVARLATVAGKADHPAVRWAAFCLGGIPVDGHPAEELAGVPVPNPSAAVGAAVGTASVAEAAALASAPGGRLVVAKRKSTMATVAIARATAVRGRLVQVDLGTGRPDLPGAGTPGAGAPGAGPTGTDAAQLYVPAELRDASAVVGTPEALDALAAIEAAAGPLRPTTRRIAVDVAAGTTADGSGAPLDPAGAAAHLAAHGHTVALVTLGDGAGLAVPPGPYELRHVPAPATRAAPADTDSDSDSDAHPADPADPAQHQGDPA